MMVKRILALILWLAAAGPVALAQSPLESPKHKLGTRSSVVGLEELSIPMTGKSTSVPSGYKNYTDEDLDEFNRHFKEAEWGHEDTAWLKACDLNTSKAYERYLAMYPYGAHAPEASVRLIEVKVNETLANAHSRLPDIKRIEEDDDSPESTIIIENNTGLTLTVLCSGTDYRSVVILPDRKASVKIVNGEYKIAASVPPSYIKPFAGQTYFQGGVYEIGFWVVSR